MDEELQQRFFQLKLLELLTDSTRPFPVMIFEAERTEIVELIRKFCLFSPKMIPYRVYQETVFVEERLEKNRIVDYVGVNEDGFPSRLQAISNPPSLLYYLGDFSLVNASKLIAIVGTRTPTPEGIEECQFITQWFIEKGYFVISGLALGIDTVVHETCLNNLGKTIAVLPSGILNIYPPENEGLADKIVNSGGLILSEYPERISAKKSSFILRDRLQSAISYGCVVIESEVSGGTMHTAKFAIKQNRPLGCVEFDDYSDNRSGNKKLLSTGKVFGINRQSLKKFEMLLKSS